MAPRYLIVGVSGFIGASLRAFFGPADTVVTYSTRPAEGGICFDARRDRLHDVVLKHYKSITHAFILYGITGIDACALDPDGTAKVNVSSVKEVIRQLVDCGITPVFASSDAVFDGSHGYWTETDTVCPILTYGRQKVAVEEFLMAGSYPYLIARLPKVVTTEPGAMDIMGSWMRDLERGVEIRCARDQIFSPIAVDDVVTGLSALVESRCSGLFHLCSPAPLSRLGLLGLLAAEVRRYRAIEAHVTPCSIRDFDFAEPRPLDTSMSAAKLHTVLGRRFKEMGEVCRTAADRRYGCDGRSGISTQVAA